jgi:hypothetical protein
MRPSRGTNSDYSREPPAYLTVAEFAAAARISRASAYRLASAGALPTRRFGRRVVIPSWALIHDATEPASLRGSGRQAR